MPRESLQVSSPPTRVLWLPVALRGGSMCPHGWPASLCHSSLLALLLLLACLLNRCFLAPVQLLESSPYLLPGGFLFVLQVSAEMWAHVCGAERAPPLPSITWLQPSQEVLRDPHRRYSATLTGGAQCSCLGPSYFAGTLPPQSQDCVHLLTSVCFVPGDSVCVCVCVWHLGRAGLLPSTSVVDIPSG